MQSLGGGGTDVFSPNSEKMRREVACREIQKFW